MKRFHKNIAIVSLFLFSGLLTNCMLNNIKDTDSILTDDYKYLSLVHGAIAWETGVIRRMYDVGQIFPVYKEDKRGRKIIENYDNPDQTHKIVRLVHALFYRVPGSTGEADFGVTTQLAHNNPLITVSLIAQIVFQCEQLRQQRDQFLNALDYVQGLIGVITDADWLSKLGRKVTRANLEQKIAKVRTMPWDENAATAFISLCKSFTKNLAKELGEQEIQKLELQQQATQKYFTMITEVTKNLRALVKPEVFKKRESVESIMVQALNERDPYSPDGLYPEYTVEMVLLAFVYKKYSYDRNILKAFYDALNVQFNGKVLVHDLDGQWVKDSFAPVTQQQAIKNITTILSVKDLMPSIQKHFAEFVYNVLQIRAFPTPVGYASAVYEYEKNKKTELADCMDNTMRNFINIYAYDAEQNKFTREKLLATLNITKVHPALADFLKVFGDVNMASSLQAHNAWLTVISNIPYIAYNQMVDGATGQSTKALESGKGYINIPENERTDDLLSSLKNSGYQVLEKNQFGYELQPSIKNIIIVLDHLLQLNLFSEAGGLAKECIRSDFIAVYLPKLCFAIHAAGFLSTEKDAKQGDIDKNFDALDYIKTELYLTFSLMNVVCEFTTYSGHGELKLVKAEGAQGEENTLMKLLEKIYQKPTVIDLWDEPSETLELPSLDILVTHVLSRQQISFGHLIDPSTYLYLNLFATPIENTALLQSIIARTFNVFTKDTPLKIKIRIKDLLLRLAERQPDIGQQQRRKFEVLKSFMKVINDDDIKNGGISLTRSLNEIIEVAANWLISIDLVLRNQALELFEALFAKRQAFDRAIEIAKKGIVDKDDKVKAKALELFILLIGNDKAFDEAFQAAINGLAGTWAVSNQSLKIFKGLIEKGQAFDRVTEVAEKIIRGQIPSVRIPLGLALLGYLLPKYSNETKKAIQKLLDDPSLTLDEKTQKHLEDFLR